MPLQKKKTCLGYLVDDEDLCGMDRTKDHKKDLGRNLKCVF